MLASAPHRSQNGRGRLDSRVSSFLWSTLYCAGENPRRLVPLGLSCDTGAAPDCCLTARVMAASLGKTHGIVFLGFSLVPNCE